MKTDNTNVSSVATIDVEKKLITLGLDDKEIMFVHYYCSPSINFVGVQAALCTMGFQNKEYTNDDYVAAQRLSTNLLRKLKIKEGIQILRRQRLKNMEVVAEDTILNIKNIVDINPTEIIEDGFINSMSDIPPELHAVIKGVKPVYQKGEIVGFNLEFYDKLKALDMLSRILGLQHTTITHEVGDNFSELLKSIKQDVRDNPDIDVEDITEYKDD